MLSGGADRSRARRSPRDLWRPGGARRFCRPAAQHYGPAVPRRSRGECLPADAIAYVGQQLWTALFHGPVLDAFWLAYHAFQKQPRAPGGRALVRLRLNVPAALRDLPWESFYVSQLGGSLTGKSEFVIVRDAPPGGVFEPLKAGADAALRILLAVPQGSGLNSQQERNNLQRQAGGDAAVEELLGRVTADALAARLASTKRPRAPRRRSTESAFSSSSAARTGAANPSSSPRRTTTRSPKKSATFHRSSAS